MTKLLNHISFARDWLNKAEEKVRRGKLVEGEFFLSLAEAEVRKAWETSYFSRDREKFKFSAVVSVVLVVIFMVFGIYFFNNYSAREEALKLSLTEKYEEEMRINENESLRLISVNLSIK